MKVCSPLFTLALLTKLIIGFQLVAGDDLIGQKKPSPSTTTYNTLKNYIQRKMNQNVSIEKSYTKEEVGDGGYSLDDLKKSVRKLKKIT